jgi:hypothetical protein
MPAVEAIGRPAENLQIPEGTSEATSFVLQAMRYDDEEWIAFPENPNPTEPNLEPGIGNQEPALRVLP